MVLTRPGNKNILAVLVLIGFMQADADLHLEMIFRGWSSLTGEQSFTNKIRRLSSEGFSSHPDGLNLNLLPTKVTKCASCTLIIFREGGRHGNFCQ